MLVATAGCLADDFTIGDAGEARDARRDVDRQDSGVDALRSDVPSVDADVADVGSSDVSVDAYRPDAPPALCDERPLPCLPSGTDRLVEVTAVEHIQNATAGDVLQVRGLNLGLAHNLCDHRHGSRGFKV